MAKSTQIKEVAKVKNHVHGLIQEPITVTGDLSIGDVIKMVREREYSFRTILMTSPIERSPVTVMGS
jgi:IMP dehydrogenase